MFIHLYCTFYLLFWFCFCNISAVSASFSFSLADLSFFCFYSNILLISTSSSATLIIVFLWLFSALFSFFWPFQLYFLYFFFFYFSYKFFCCSLPIEIFVFTVWVLQQISAIIQLIVDSTSTRHSRFFCHFQRYYSAKMIHVAFSQEIKTVLDVIVSKCWSPVVHEEAWSICDARLEPVLKQDWSNSCLFLIRASPARWGRKDRWHVGFAQNSPSTAFPHTAEWCFLFQS